MKNFYLKDLNNEKDLKFALDMIEEEIENYFLSQDPDNIIPLEEDEDQPVIIYSMLNGMTSEMQEYFVENAEKQDGYIGLN